MNENDMAASISANPPIFRLPREVHDNIHDMVAEDDKRSLFLSIRLRGGNMQPDVRAYTTHPTGQTCSTLRREYAEAVVRRFKGLSGGKAHEELGDADASEGLFFHMGRVQCLETFFTRHTQSITFSTILCLGALWHPTLLAGWFHNLKIEFVADEYMELDEQASKFWPHDKSCPPFQIPWVMRALTELVNNADWSGSVGCLMLWNGFLQCGASAGSCTVIKYPNDGVN